MPQVVGSVGDLAVVMTAPDGTPYNLGTVGRQFGAYQGEVCVTGRPLANRLALGGGMPFEVTAYRLRGDGRREPLIGVMSMVRSAYVFTARGGHRFAIADPAPALEQIIGQTIFVWLRRSGSKYAVDRFGLLSIESIPPHPRPEPPVATPSAAP